MIELWAGVAVALALAAPRAVTTDNSPAEIIVTAPGGSIDADDTQRIEQAQISRNRSPDLLSVLERRVPGLSLNSAQGNA